MIEASDVERDIAKRDIIVTKLNQSAVYTKRARPTIVYAGLAIIAANYVLFPQLSSWLVTLMDEKSVAIPTITMPDAFWTA